MDFQAQMETLQARSDAAMKLGPPGWLNPANFCCDGGPLSKNDLQGFFDDGFIILPIFGPEELQPVIKDIEEQVDALADQLYAAGKIKDKAEGEGFYQRMHRLEQQYAGANVCLHKHGVLPPSVQRLWSDKRLVDIAQQLLGGPQVDVAGHPVWNLRVKVPGAEAAVVPWHQDAAYLDPEATHTLQVTAWIPLLDAKTENGCMQIIRGGHRSGNVSKHSCCAGGTWYVELDLDAAEETLGLDCKDESNWVTCEMPMGHVLFLNNLVPHRSLSNVSKDTRWSLDLRWQDARLPAGFWGIKDTILIRQAGDAGYTPQWGAWAAEDRNSAQAAVVGSNTDEQVWGRGQGEAQTSQTEGKSEAPAEKWDLVPTIAGPWMRRWPLVHHNAHTELFGLHGGGDETTWHKA